MSNARYSDKQLAKKYGRRPGGTPLDFPQELGYRCPLGHSNLQWSEFKKHIWCFVCQIDYHSIDECFLVKDKFNPTLSKMPKIISAVSNMDKTGNFYPNVPKKYLPKKERKDDLSKLRRR